MDKNINKKINKLTIIRFDHYGKNKEKYYLFECECGKQKVINFQNVKQGKTKSCGCNYKIRAEKDIKKTNKFRFCKNYIIGYTTNTNNKFYIDLEDFDKIKDISWYEASNGYICHKEKNQKVIFMHRYIINAKENKLVDHINHNKKDNRKINLRLVDYKQNALNRQKIPKGICKLKTGHNKYYVIQLNGYRGIYKEYKKAKIERDKIIEKEYKLFITEKGEIENE